ncbi:heparan-alpha-glucosaminide N-acetyltransferase domain-containing protein [Kocuria atrinae]|uniref:heparan-alpha-glucosaminide N-acetyltransferase domain-containing protein n=1 Tax=Kocuria atrinae TaxID=592377 RepID=UPI000362DF68|nr:heparan-alpha-glucosaminide N-acetyltransferase domain-containing protein [Kocuria atrinae]
MSTASPPRSMSQRVKQNVARVESPGRIPGIDLARGLAILGMYVAHLTVVAPLEWSRPETWLGVVEGRSAILFATLAGVSLGLMGAGLRTRADAQDAVRAQPSSIVIRAVLIWALGLLLLSLDVPVFVVLPAYGVLLLIGAFMVSWSTRALVITAAFTAAIAPFVVTLLDSGGPPASGSVGEFFSDMLGWNYPFVLWLAFVAVGIIAGRLIRRGIGSTVLLLGSGVALAVLGYAVLGPVGNQVVGRYGTDLPVSSSMWLMSVFRDDPHSHGVGEAFGSGGFALAVLALCVLAGTTALRWLLWPLRVIGSMPLTAYTAHLLVWGIWIMVTPGVGSDIHRLHGFLALDPFWPITLGVTAGCIVWALIWGKGPLEQLVHVLSTGATQSTSPKDQNQPERGKAGEL